mmetsp:Transcript_100758/g.260342  ORF Transcript_100758/g.260342 Transcript_100758/m.260342 type:complete len:204 (+) Transcript_100758:1256-1867(+)
MLCSWSKFLIMSGDASSTLIWAGWPMTNTPSSAALEASHHSYFILQPGANLLSASTQTSASWIENDNFFLTSTPTLSMLAFWTVLFTSMARRCAMWSLAPSRSTCVGMVSVDMRRTMPGCSSGSIWDQSCLTSHGCAITPNMSSRACSCLASISVRRSLHFGCTDSGNSGRRRRIPSWLQNGRRPSSRPYMTTPRAQMSTFTP